MRGTYVTAFHGTTPNRNTIKTERHKGLSGDVSVFFFFFFFFSLGQKPTKGSSRKPISGITWLHVPYFHLVFLTLCSVWVFFFFFFFFFLLINVFLCLFKAKVFRYVMLRYALWARSLEYSNRFLNWQPRYSFLFF